MVWSTVEPFSKCATAFAAPVQPVRANVRSVVADVPCKKDGKYAMLALAKLDGRLVATSPIGVQVGGKKVVPPGVGDKAPVIHTLTPADVAGNVAKIDTHIPPAPSL